MENANLTNTNNTGVISSAPVIENASYEAYMSSDKVNIPDEVIEEVKKYTLRKLNSTDLFPMIKIISKIGLDELTQVFESDSIKDLITKAKSEIKEGSEEPEGDETKEGKNQFMVGVGIALKLANKILEHIPSCEREIYMLLGNVSGMSIDEVKVLGLDVFMEMLIDFIMKDEFKSFFKVASKYIKR